MHVILINLIGLLGIAGFLISAYIYLKKKSKQKLVCPRRSNCDTVIHSDYSKILGIPVEILGMVYYFFAGSVYSYIFIYSLWSTSVGIILVGVSMCAILFSIYLVSLQLFVVKHWCAWCLCSAAICLLIFILSYAHLTIY